MRSIPLLAVPLMTAMILLGACAAGSGTGGDAITDPGSLSASERASLQAELREIARLDQVYRTSVAWGTTDPEELARLKALDDDAQMAEMFRRSREGLKLDEAEAARLMALQTEIDRANFAHLVELTCRYGYPDAERLGLGTPDVTGVLIHARPDAFDANRALFFEEVIAGRMKPGAYAMMVDRGLQHQGLAQLYGTAVPFDPKTGGVGPAPIEDIGATNDARAEIGLPPLESYTIIGAD